MGSDSLIDNETPEEKTETPAANAGGIANILSWVSPVQTPTPRSSTPQPSTPRPSTARRNAGFDTEADLLGHRRRKSLKSCSHAPPLRVRWFHAIDVPKRKPFALTKDPQEKLKPDVVAKKYQPFSESDSNTIEAAFKKLKAGDMSGLERIRSKENRSLDDGKTRNSTKIPVNEDYLFDVDIEHRELAPAYWLGPVYDVRRGSWFYAEKPYRPCDESLATKLEEAYQNFRPWTFKTPAIDPITASRHNSAAAPNDKSPEEKIQDTTTSQETEDTSKSTIPLPQDRSVQMTIDTLEVMVTFEEDDSAYIVTNDLYSRMSSTMYQRFGGGAHFAGVKVVRGYSEPEKKVKETGSKPEDKDIKTASQDAVVESESSEDEANDQPRQETVRQRLERQVSTFVSKYNPETEEEVTRKRDEQEIRHDYNDDSSEQQEREIEHLVLITHGVGQRLGMRLEGVNFIHDVNTLRKTMKAVYGESTDLQVLNGETEKPVKNCRIQVLPVVWRHLLDFPRHSIKETRKYHDIGAAEGPSDDNYPTLDQITLTGVPAIRNLITDLGLDILLYQSPVYKPHITKIVLDECNRIWRLFKTRNPNFNGKVSLLGHSLGSAVLFDLLCAQKLDSVESGSFLGFKRYEQPHFYRELQLEFDVQDFYAFGSPMGLFQMLKGRTIAARQTPNIKPAQTPFGPPPNLFEPDYFEILTSAPKCEQMFNIFHPTDPIAYRLEPLISPEMAKLPPQPLPYTKKNMFSNLPAPPSGLSFIGARVGQNLSGLWNSFQTGLAHTLLNRSLGIYGDETRIENPLPLSLRPTMPVTPGLAPLEPEKAKTATLAVTPGSQGGFLSAEDAKKLVAEESGELVSGGEGENPPTLLDTGLETLFSGFEKQKPTLATGELPIVELPTILTSAEDAQQGMLKREDKKVRALNKNGRVDYSIQEGAFDISLLASVASHLSYWSDEDVSHFMISQLLSRQRSMKKTTSYD